MPISFIKLDNKSLSVFVCPNPHALPATHAKDYAAYLSSKPYKYLTSPDAETCVMVRMAI
jgi:hypothetical protein